MPKTTPPEGLTPIETLKARNLKRHEILDVWLAEIRTISRSREELFTMSSVAIYCMADDTADHSEHLWDVLVVNYGRPPEPIPDDDWLHGLMRRTQQVTFDPNLFGERRYFQNVPEKAKKVRELKEVSVPSLEGLSEAIGVAHEEDVGTSARFLGEFVKTSISLKELSGLMNWPMPRTIQAALQAAQDGLLELRQDVFYGDVLVMPISHQSSNYDI